MNVQSKEVDIDVWSSNLAIITIILFVLCFRLLRKKLSFFLGHPVTILSGNFAIQIPEKPSLGSFMQVLPFELFPYLY